MTDEPKTILHTVLRSQRDSLRRKLDGLSELDARLPRTPTGTNLLGLYKHVGSCEPGYFGETFGRPSDLPFPWDAEGVEPEDDPDLFAHEGESMTEVLQWVDGCFAHADATIEALPLDATGSVPWWRPGNTVTLERILVHMIEEEARHAGQADILRELVDGAVGRHGADDNVPDRGEGGWAAHHERLTRIAEARA